MDYYLTSMRCAADQTDITELKSILDFYLEQATADYKGGALALDEFYDIINEYDDLLKTKNAVNYA